MDILGRIQHHGMYPSSFQCVFVYLSGAATDLAIFPGAGLPWHNVDERTITVDYIRLLRHACRHV